MKPTINYAGLWGRQKELRAKFEASKPFKHLAVNSFLADEFLLKLEKEIKEDVSFQRKDNDLYQIWQSYDLAAVKERYCAWLRDAMFGDKFVSFLEDITGASGLRRGTADLFVSAYGSGDYLLCHDDCVGTRKIAFLIYVTAPKWDYATDGGALALFDSTLDADGCVEPCQHPCAFVNPTRNSFALFEVSSRSFHSVMEVTTATKHRLAFGGWFHCDEMAHTKCPRPIELPWRSCTSIAAESECAEEHLSVEFWVNEEYLKPTVQKKVSERFCEESSIDLRDFLLAERYYALIAEMEANKSTLFALSGIPHRGLYLRLNEEQLLASAKNICTVFKMWVQFTRSNAWRQFLADLSCLNVATENFAECRLFERGHYTLAHDLDTRKDSVGLDAHFCLLLDETHGWKQAHGGATIYMDSGEDLLTVAPFPNSLSLVYRALPGVSSFVKYLAASAPSAVCSFTQTWRVADDVEVGDSAQETEPEEVDSSESTVGSEENEAVKRTLSAARETDRV